MTTDNWGIATLGRFQTGACAVLSVKSTTEEQAAFLLRHGCKLAQGYFYSRPVLAQDMLERWIDH